MKILLIFPSTLPKYVTSATHKDTAYKLKPKIVLTPTSIFLNNAYLTI